MVDLDSFRHEDEIFREALAGATITDDGYIIFPDEDPPTSIGDWEYEGSVIKLTPAQYRAICKQCRPFSEATVQQWLFELDFWFQDKDRQNGRRWLDRLKPMLARKRAETLAAYDPEGVLGA